MSKLLCSVGRTDLRQLSLRAEFNLELTILLLSAELSVEISGKCHHAQIDAEALNKKKMSKLNFVRIIRPNQESFLPRNLSSERIKTKKQYKHLDG